MLNIGLEQQQRIVGANGDILWTGGQAIATSYIAKSSEASNSFAMGEAALWDPQTVAVGFIPRQATNPTETDFPQSIALGIKRLTATPGGVGFLGVVQEPVGPGKRGLVAGIGSLTTVKVDTGTTIAVGTLIASTSSTAGLVSAAGTRSATVPAYGTVLGMCIKTNTTGADGTGSTGFAGVLVSPQ